MVALVEKWVWIHHEQEFKEYEQQLESKGSNQPLLAVIGELIE
jgi:hypothetical protein